MVTHCVSGEESWLAEGVGGSSKIVNWEGRGGCRSDAQERNPRNGEAGLKIAQGGREEWIWGEVRNCQEGR